MSYASLSTFGNDHSTWLGVIDFYTNEFNILKNRLQEMVRKNNPPEAMAGVEHFQNQFIVQRNNIDELKHIIKEHKGKVARDAKAHEGTIEDALVTDHNELKEQIGIFEKIAVELRNEFNQFLEKWT